MNISVYITSYNQQEYLKEAIESVLSQTLLPKEIWVIDDASTDGSQETIRNYINKYPNLIKAHFNDTNKGITFCRNKGISLVSEEYATWLDGDDIYLPQKLEIQAKLIQETKSDVVCTNFYLAEDNISNLVRIWCSDIKQLPSSENIFTNVLSRKFPRSTLFRYELVKTDLLKSVGGYDKKLRIYEDFDFRIRLCKYAKVSFSFLPLSVYRLHSNGLSRAPKELHIVSLTYIFEKYRKDIQNLPKKKKEEVESAINIYLERFDGVEVEKKRKSLKNSFKSKLKRLIDKM